MDVLNGLHQRVLFIPSIDLWANIQVFQIVAKVLMFDVARQMNGWCYFREVWPDYYPQVDLLGGVQ